MRHSPGAILPARTYVINPEAAQALRDAGIKFNELSDETDAPTAGNAVSGERI